METSISFWKLGFKKAIRLICYNHVVIEREEFPPCLPQVLQRKGDLWLGTGVYDPHLYVKGPDIKSYYDTNTPVRLSVECHTIDMRTTEFDKMGTVDATILDIYPADNEPYIHFLATGKFPFGGIIFVSEYAPHIRSRADVLISH